jgi:auxin efflux carrier family protein
MRFSLGPAMLHTREANRDEEADIVPSHEVPNEGTALLPKPPARTRFTRSIKSLPKDTWNAIRSMWNPPLTGAILAVFIGLIPPVKRQFYHKEGFFYGTITTSLTNIGELFTALMLFVLGASLQIKTSRDASTPIKVLIYIYVMRFLLLPGLSILIVWKISDWGWLNDTAHQGLGSDPMMKFIMCLIPAGPPYPLLKDNSDRSAIVLANIAELAGVAQGQVGKLLILSYVVSPTIAFTVAAALYMITNLG